VGTDGSYLSAHDPRVHFGLGADAELKESPIEKIVVTWPGGSKESWPVTKADQILHLSEGTGKSVK
jgi:hypothetical protein